MSPDKLIHMANQIGRAFAHEPRERAVADTAIHIRKFWEPRMRAAIFAALDTEDGARLDSIAREAVGQLRERASGLKSQ
ncbi:MAG: formate dehydrogenase subunit delta [Acetobacteraceae bacterium]